MKRNDPSLITNIDEMKKKLQEILSQKLVVTAGTKQDFEAVEGIAANGEKLMRGLASSHAYTLLGMENKGGVDYVKLRNPWGVGNVSYYVQKQTGQKVLRKNNNAGPFFIELNTFFRLFDQIDTLKV